MAPRTSPETAKFDVQFARRAQGASVIHSSGLLDAGKMVMTGPDGRVHESLLPVDMAELPRKFNELTQYLLSLGFELPESLIDL